MIKKYFKDDKMFEFIYNNYLKFKVSSSLIKVLAKQIVRNI